MHSYPHRAASYTERRLGLIKPATHVHRHKELIFNARPCGTVMQASSVKTYFFTPPSPPPPPALPPPPPPFFVQLMLGPTAFIIKSFQLEEEQAIFYFSVQLVLGPSAFIVKSFELGEKQAIFSLFFVQLVLGPTAFIVKGFKLEARLFVHARNQSAKKTKHHFSSFLFSHF